MKKVILKKEESEVITIDKITNTSIVGACWNDKSKYVVLPSGENIDKYVFKGYSLDGVDCITNPYTERSKKLYALGVIESENGEVFVFGNIKELCKWLSE